MITYVIQDLPLENYSLIQLLAMEYRGEIDAVVAILFMQNSVLLFKNDRFKDVYDQLKANKIKMFAVQKDIIARGVELPLEVEVVNYDDVVDLLMNKSTKVFNL